MKTKEVKRNKGITLIALVITIIVLLILAGVSIAMLTGENGVLTKATQAKIQEEQGTVKENIRLLISEHTAYLYTNETDKIKSDFIVWMHENQYIDENDTVNIEKLLGQKLSTGNGDPEGYEDVYKLFETYETGKVASLEIAAGGLATDDVVYELYYYDKNGEETLIDNFKKEEDISSETTTSGYFTVTKDGVLNLIDEYAYKSIENEKVPFPDEVLNIPSKINGIQVKAIDYYTFKGISGIKQVIIQDGIEEIGIGAFEDNTMLESIIIPDTVNSIGAYAFFDCSALTNITLPKNLSSIKSRVFYGCKSLQNITIPSKVETIETGAFLNCTNLKSIIIPKNVNEINVDLDSSGFNRTPIFEGCTGLTEVILEKGSTLEINDDLAAKLGVNKNIIRNGT